jgi:hypothetical protein
MRILLALLAALAAASLTGCGSSDPPPAAPGSADNPLQAQAPEAGATAPDADSFVGEGEQRSTVKPGYKALVDRQSRRPRNRFTPCDLVTAAQAGAILGAKVRVTEAPQGPTCIYQTPGVDGFVTLAVQATAITQLKRNMRGVRRVQVSDRDAYCGTYGRSMLYVPLSRGRVLSIAAACPVAQQFAATAVRQLAA